MKNILNPRKGLLHIVACTILVFIFQVSFAQDGVRIAASAGTADPSAMIDVVSTNKGALVPRMTAAQRTAIASPATGLLVFQTDGTPGFWYNAGTPGTPNWVILSAGALSGAGVTNYVTKWTASNVLGTGSIYDNGNVGIGTTVPGYKLDVQGGSLNVGTLYGTSVMYGTLGSFDTRSTNPNPETYNMGVTSEFKNGAAIGLVDGGTYNTVLSLRQWSSGGDWSGGGVHQIGLTPNGNMHLRYSQTSGSWGPWKKVLTEDSRPIIWSGGCTSHGTAGGWNTYCSNAVEFNTAGAHLSTNGNGVFNVLKSGYYRINMWAISLGNGYGHVIFYHNNVYRYYGHEYVHGAWSDNFMDFVWPMNAGDNFYIQFYNSGNYAYHSWNSQGAHSRLQIEYRGNL